MALTPSNRLPLGTRAPAFTLLDTVDTTSKNLEDLKGERGTVILFICNHCPFVIHVNEKLVALANEFQPKGINFIAISSNDIKKYPEDAPQKMQEQAKKLHYPFPYLYDVTQEVAKAYAAACTPDIYAFTSNLELVYHGQLDDSRPGNSIPVTGKDLQHALDCLLENIPNTQPQKPSIGCGIKWK